MAKNSCLFEQPDASKIRLTMGEVSSSIVAREEALDPCLVVALTAEGREEGGAMSDDERGTF